MTDKYQNVTGIERYPYANLLRFVIFSDFLKKKSARYVAHSVRSSNFEDGDIFGGIGVSFRIILKQISF